MNFVVKHNVQMLGLFAVGETVESGRAARQRYAPCMALICASYIAAASFACPGVLTISPACPIYTPIWVLLSVCMHCCSLSDSACAHNAKTGLLHKDNA